MGSAEYGEPNPEWDEEIEDATSITVAEVVGQFPSFVYEYDLGDSWQHDIVLLRSVPAPTNSGRTKCLEGGRACPPEDCGGVMGYAELLEALSDPHHPEHDEMRTWAGEDFDPEAFDLAAVNRRLLRLRLHTA